MTASDKQLFARTNVRASQAKYTTGLLTTLSKILTKYI